MPESSINKLSLYRSMLTIRRFEERCNYLFMQGKIPSTLHLYIGQEAVAVGVCAHLTAADYATSTHRPHGHSIAKGVSLRSIMAELYAKRTGCCKGKGGSMHVGDMTVGMIPAIAIVGGNIPLTTGLALACKRLAPSAGSPSAGSPSAGSPSAGSPSAGSPSAGSGGGSRVAVAFMGDGATNEGAFHEGLNMAAIWDLPAVFVVENNLYAASTPIGVTFKITDIAGRAASYGMASAICDGMDVLAVHEAAGRAIARARAGGGPTLLECKTYRLCGHSRSDPRTYRSKEEEAEWATRDPITRLAAQMQEAGLATAESLAQIEAEVVSAIDDAVAFAESSPSPAPEEALEDVFWEAGRQVDK